MKRIYIAAFGSGMGHASRMATVARVLRASGCEVAFSSSGEVTQWLRNSGFVCNDLPLVDVIFTEDGAFSAKETLKFSPLIFARLYKQVRKEIENIGRYRPDVVLSDSMMASILASGVHGVKSVAVLNQLRLISSPRTPRVIGRLLSAGSVNVGDMFWGFCDKVLVPDLPPPYTISEANLWHAGRTAKRMDYVGFMTSWLGTDDGAEALWEAGKKRVFWLVSGPPRTRGHFLAKALAVAKALKEKYSFVITSGNPGGSRVPQPIPGGHIYGWCPSPVALVKAADVVVSRAGHVSLSEYIIHSKPSILCPIPSQTEQMGNAAKASRLGMACTLDESTITPEMMDETISTVISGTYVERVRNLNRVASGYDALRAIVQTVTNS